MLGSRIFGGSSSRRKDASASRSLLKVDCLKEPWDLSEETLRLLFMGL